MTEHTGWRRSLSTVRERARAVARITGRVRRHRWTRRVRIGAAVALVSIGGAIIGTMLFAHAGVNVGPFRAEMAISPSVLGGTEVDIPPLGSLHLDSHDGPIHLKVNLGSLDQSRTEALIDDPGAISSAGENAVDDVRTGVLRLGVRTLGIAVLSALLLAALIFRNVRRVAAAGVTALVVTGGSLGLAAGTLRPDSIAEPRYEGLLVNAPAVVGDARRIADNYGRYADQLQQIVSNVSRLYTTVSTLPVYQPEGNTTRILHVSDLHLNPSSWGLIRTVVQTFDIDAVVDTGDMVDWGSAAETSYVSSIPSVGVPYIYVRGNHDSTVIQAAVARQRGAVVLDNRITTVDGLTIAGIGDPEFTPDKTTVEQPADNADAASSPLTDAGGQLAAPVRLGAAGSRRPPAPARGQHPGRTRARPVRVGGPVPVRHRDGASDVDPPDGRGLHRRRRPPRPGEGQTHPVDPVGPLLRREPRPEGLRRHRAGRHRSVQRGDATQRGRRRRRPVPRHHHPLGPEQPMTNRRLAGVAVAVLAAGATTGCTTPASGPSLRSDPALSPTVVAPDCRLPGARVGWSKLTRQPRLTRVTLFRIVPTDASTHTGDDVFDTPFTPTITHVAAPAGWAAQLATSLSAETGGKVQAGTAHPAAGAFGVLTGGQDDAGIPETLLYEGVETVAATFSVDCERPVTGVFTSWTTTSRGGVTCGRAEPPADPLGRLARRYCPRTPSPDRSSSDPGPALTFPGG
jgi:hypothetical protein